MVWDSGENNETQQAEAAAETRQSAAEKMRASRAAFLRKLDDAKKPAKATANASNDSGPAAKKSRKDTKLPEASAASAVTAKPRTITSIVAASNASDNLVSDNDRHTVSPKQDETISTPKSNITEIRPNKNKLDSGEKKSQRHSCSIW